MNYGVGCKFHILMSSDGSVSSPLIDGVCKNDVFLMNKLLVFYGVLNYYGVVTSGRCNGFLVSTSTGFRTFSTTGFFRLFTWLLLMYHECYLNV
jgi:hypothetical protein